MKKEPRKIDEQFMREYLTPLFKQHKVHPIYKDSKLDKGKITIKCDDSMESVIVMPFEMYKKLKIEAVGSLLFSER